MEKWRRYNNQRPRLNQFRQPKIYSRSENVPSITLTPKHFLGFLIIIAISVLVWFLFFSSYFRIKNLMIDGLVTAEIQTRLEKLRNKNLLILRVHKMENDLKKLQSDIKNLEILKGFPDTLKIKITLRESKLIWQSGGSNYLVDKDGIVYTGSEGNLVNAEGKSFPLIVDSKNIPIKISAQIVSPAFVSFVNEITQNFEAKIGVKLANFEVNETTLQIDAKTEAGWKVIFDTTRGLASQLDDLAKIYNANKDNIHEYIDLRVAGWGYYK